MTEERFWDLAEGGARCLVVGLQWLLIWPFVLLGLVASGMEAATAGETTKIGSTEGDSPVGEAETPKGTRP